MILHKFNLFHLFSRSQNITDNSGTRRFLDEKRRVYKIGNKSESKP